VSCLATSVADSPDAALAISDLAAADAYTHRHSVDVTALGWCSPGPQWRREGWVAYRGRRRYDRLDERLAHLGLGLLLHDIGKYGRAGRRAQQGPGRSTRTSGSGCGRTLGPGVDPEIVATFRRIVFPHPVRHRGRAARRRTGVVVRVDRDAPDVPPVRLQGADGPVEMAFDTLRELAA
jgi:hypothetical protein